MFEYGRAPEKPKTESESKQRPGFDLWQLHAPEQHLLSPGVGRCKRRQHWRNHVTIVESTCYCMNSAGYVEEWQQI